MQVSEAEFKRSLEKDVTGLLKALLYTWSLLENKYKTYYLNEPDLWNSTEMCLLA